MAVNVAVTAVAELGNFFAESFFPFYLFPISPYFFGNFQHEGEEFDNFIADRQPAKPGQRRLKSICKRRRQI